MGNVAADIDAAREERGVLATAGKYVIFAAHRKHGGDDRRLESPRIRMKADPSRPAELRESLVGQARAHRVPLNREEVRHIGGSITQACAPGVQRTASRSCGAYANMCVFSCMRSIAG